MKVGIVLSGGSGRGLCYAGVLKELEAAGIQIDHIAAASMGGIIGGCYASFKNTDYTCNGVLNDMTRQNVFHIKDFFKGKNGLSGFEKKLEVLGKYIPPHLEFKDLRVPLTLCTMNITTGESEIIESGNVLQAVNKAIAFPLLFSPVEHNGALYSDGAGLRPLLINECRKHCDIVIVAYVAPEINKIKSLHMFGRLKHCYHLFFNEINTTLLEMDPPDISIIVDTNIPMWSFNRKNSEICIDAGERATRGKIPEIKRLIKEKEEELRLKEARQERQKELMRQALQTSIERRYEIKRSALLKEKMIDE